jgi:hypothetical protein
MKKVLKYINNNIVELVALRDIAILAVMLVVAWELVKFAIINIA